MALIVVGLMKDAHQARGLIRALADAGFEREEIDMGGNCLADLIARGVPETEAHYYAEGVRRGGAIVAVNAENDLMAEQAAHLMSEHGAVDMEACVAGWMEQGWSGRVQPEIEIEHYAMVFGEYPAALGRIYGRPYRGPERRQRDEPYTGVNRRRV